ncbi:uncharacterized protein LOC135345408 isoform X2 [Halichondria panicea]|uniref:uncharacterized protein LOC135345408 isoform X2 n=1 Tax=Halichondria panicea TaxID=6063 RepID=UPI00312B64E8
MSESAEYKAFMDCHSSLLTCVQQSPKDVCDQLLPFEILAPDDLGYLKNDTHDNGDKARRIMESVMLQIKNNPLVFNSLVSALEKAGSFTKAVVQKLHDAFQRQNQQCDQTQRMEERDNKGQAGEELQPRSASTSSSGFESLTASDSNTDRKFFNFQCGCGKCTILGHVKGRDKCLSSKPPQIKTYTRDTPYSGTVSATEISYSMFMTALHKETRYIHSKFCSLLTDTITNLEAKYDITKVLQYVKALLTPTESYYKPIYLRPSEEIQFPDVTSFSKLSDFLQNNFCSWFNYSLISAIREKFLFPNCNDDEDLQSYERFFQQYVNRRCFLFVDDFGPEPSHIESMEITCKIDVDFDAISYDQIQELKLVFIECWEQLLPHQVLNLKNVREGCTELVFRVPACFKHVYGQLSLKQMQHLKEKRFIEVKIGQQTLLKAEANSISPADAYPGTASMLSEPMANKLLKVFGQDGGDQTSALALLIGLDPTVDVSSIRDSDGMTLLHLSCRWDWSKWGLLVTQLVKTHHHNVSVVNEDGDTPLHIAARFNNKGAAKYLLELSDVNARNNAGLTSFDIADQKQHQEVLRVLVECNANIPIISAPIISTHDVSLSDEPIHGTSSDSDALPMSPCADESTSPQGDDLNSVSDVSSTKEDLSSISTLSHQSRAERYGSTIRSRNLRSVVSESSQHYTPPPVLKSEVDDDDDDGVYESDSDNPPGYSESTRLPTIPSYSESNENGPPRYNLPDIRPPAYSNQQPPPSQQDSEAINDLHTQPDDSDSQNNLIINDSQPHEEHQNTVSSTTKSLCTGFLSFVDNHWGKVIYKMYRCNRTVSEESSQRFSRLYFFTGILAFAAVFVFLMYITTNPPVYEGSLHIAQLLQPSILPIALVRPDVLHLTLTEIPNAQIIPIYFNISNCDDIRKENSTIYEEGILTPEENTPIYELYTEYIASLRLQIQLSADYNSSDLECPFVLVVFDDVKEYESFLHNGSWTFTYMEYCIKTDNFSISIILAANSYYFFGVHFEAISHIMGNITYRINGWKEENSTSSFTSLCSITSTATTAACNYNFDSFVNTPELCIIGVVSKRNASDVVRKAEIQYSYSSSFSSKNSLPLWLILITLFLVWLLVPPIYKKLKTGSNRLMLRIIIFIFILFILVFYLSIVLILVL